jgi:hypothetical protein
MGMAASRSILDTNGDGATPVDTPLDTNGNGIIPVDTQHKWGWHPLPCQFVSSIDWDAAIPFVSSVDRDAAILICVEYRPGCFHPHFCQVSTGMLISPFVSSIDRDEMGMAASRSILDTNGDGATPVDTPLHTNENGIIPVDTQHKWGWYHPSRCSTQMRWATGVLPSPFVSSIDQGAAITICVERGIDRGGTIPICVEYRPGCCHPICVEC